MSEISDEMVTEYNRAYESATQDFAPDEMEVGNPIGIHAGLAAALAGHVLLPPAAEVHVEFGAWCHAENRDGIRLLAEEFASRWRAAEWGAEQIGKYGIEGYRVMRREHHVFAEGARFHFASTNWVEDVEEVAR